jgi:hypothetical protein
LKYLLVKGLKQATHAEWSGRAKQAKSENLIDLDINFSMYVQTTKPTHVNLSSYSHTVAKIRTYWHESDRPVQVWLLCDDRN